MQPDSFDVPPDCQSAGVSADGDPLGRVDAARQWAHRLPWAVLRRARRVAGVMGRGGRVNGSNGATQEAPTSDSPELSGPPIRAGAVVEVRSYKEILATLDHQRKCDGLEFMEGMKAFCGRRLVVLKKVELLFDEAAQRMLRIRKERYVLEGAICDGRGTCQREGCDRCCFYFWSRPWLREPR